jgi:hypothetical protein
MMSAVWKSLKEVHDAKEVCYVRRKVKPFLKDSRELLDLHLLDSYGLMLVDAITFSGLG